MEEKNQCLLGVMMWPLPGGCPAHHTISIPAIECLWVLIELYIDGQYESHDDVLFSYIENGFLRVHTAKDTP